MKKAIPYESTRALLLRIFSAYGFSSEQSSVITDALLAADLAGIESHGIQRMIRYDNAISCGMVDVNAIPETIYETPISAVIDAKRAMGQIVSVTAMQTAISKAGTYGVGMVTVRNSNHFGIAGYYARMASAEGLIGVAMTNSEAIMVPTNSRRAMLGTNPIALAAPADPIDFCFDAATTVVTRGKLEVYNKAEEQTPDGWTIDARGRGCCDPATVIANITARAGGGILPLGGASEVTGGHKGYGYGLICEIFTAVLSGGPPSYLSYKEQNVADTSHYFMAIDPAVFDSPERIRARLSALLDDLRKATPAEDGMRIYVHGEKEVEFAETVLKNGIPVNQKTVDELCEIAKRLNIPFQQISQII